MDALDKERLDVLAGVRNPGSKQMAAVRRGDLAAIVSLSRSTTKPIASGGTVTADAFNALLADYTALRQALEQVAAKVKP